MEKARVVVFGANGFLGPEVVHALTADGYELCTVTRHDWPVAPEVAHRSWDGRSLGPWTEAVEGATAVLNLAGKSINCRHHAQNLKAILASRVESTAILAEAIAACASPPRVWLNASSAAIYAPREGQQAAATEDDAVDGGDALREVAIAWERALFTPELPATRRLALRISLVLGEQGALPVLRRLCRWGLGGAAGGGRQWMSWITVEDFCRAVRFLIEHEELSGPVNLASPTPLENREFMAILRRHGRCPFGLPAPRLAVQLGAKLVGTEAKLILDSMKVQPTRLLAAGFTFRAPTLELALDGPLRVS